jgi:predicted phage terminase large subunit-like protein
MCSVAFPAFVLGHDPTKRFIVVSYNANLAHKLGSHFRTILQSSWYQDIFYDTRISRLKNTQAEVVTTRHGSRFATSVGGTLTGRGGDFVIVDDPLKPREAYSDKRESVNDWFDNTAYSRLDNKLTGVIIVAMQRLHVNDLSGKLLRSSDEWTVLNLPAIAEKDEQIQIGNQLYHFRQAGDLLQPEREPMEVLNCIRAQIPPDVFAAQFQQNPIAPDGNMIKRHWVRRYETLPDRTPSIHVLQSWDTASKEGEQNAFSVCTTLYVQEGKYYLVDVLRDRFDYPTLKDRAIAHARLHNPTTILVEDTGVGTALVSELRNCAFTVIAVQPEHNKQTRMSVQSTKFASGQVLFPNEAPWLQDFEAELFAFPGSQFDDQIDSVSQALGHQIEVSSWNDKSLEGLRKFTEGLLMDRYWGDVMGRPW